MFSNPDAADHRHCFERGRHNRWLHIYAGWGCSGGFTTWAIEIGPLYWGWTQ